jgi:glycerol-3-phosphate acyltransferase PlsY
VGHIFPIWAEFQGGKGVATVIGMVLGIQPVVQFVVLESFYWFVSNEICFVKFNTCKYCVPNFILVIFNEPEDLYRIFAIAVRINGPYHPSKKYWKTAAGK